MSKDDITYSAGFLSPARSLFLKVGVVALAVDFVKALSVLLSVFLIRSLVNRFPFVGMFEPPFAITFPVLFAVASTIAAHVFGVLGFLFWCSHVATVLHGLMVVNYA